MTTTPTVLYESGYFPALYESRGSLQPGAEPMSRAHARAREAASSPQVSALVAAGNRRNQSNRGSDGRASPQVSMRLTIQ
jgi:hypothetical protein